MATAFTRQLGAESGAQLNPLRDESIIPEIDNSDQSFAIAMRATRGRIDKPFLVNRSNITQKLGRGEQIRVSALNEAWVHVNEALNNGAYQAVVQRLVTSAAAVKWAKVVVNDSGTTHTVTFSVSDTAPTEPYLLAIKHLECFNDGIKVSFRADEYTVSSVVTKNSIVTLRLRDSTGILLYEFTGSLVAGALDDYGNSYYLPDVVAAQSDGAVEVTVGVTGASAAIDTASPAYGYDSDGVQKWATSDTLVCFTEGGTSYETADYQAACAKLKATQHDYGYISSGGTQSFGMLAQLALLAFDTNRQLRFDVPGNLTPTAAITFVEQLSMGASETSHLMHAYWAPLQSNDPTGINPRGYFGTSTLNIAYACRRNSATNAKGFARKNQPIAGKDWPLNRTGLQQTYFPNQQELNALARAQINPVSYETYSGGGRYVFRDSLTCALVDSSLKKLISVAEMSTSIDDAVTRYGKDVLQLPMDLGIKRMSDYLTALFAGAEAAGWLVPSTAAHMDGRAWKFNVQRNAARPYDLMDVEYWLHYDGTVRQIYVTQTLSK